MSEDEKKEVAEATESTFTQAELDAAIKDAVTKQVEGLKRNNADLKAEKKAATDKLKQFEGIDLSKLQELAEKAETQEQKQAIENGDLEKAIQGVKDAEQRRFKKAIEDRDSKVAELELVIQERDKQLYQYTVIDGLKNAAIAAGVRNEAVGDAVALAEQEIQKDQDGKWGFRDNSGGILISSQSDRAGEYMQSEEYFKTFFKEKRSYLYPASTGAGVSGSNQGAGSNEPNPFKQQYGAVTAQSRLIKNDPEKARRFIKEAGRNPADWKL